jgi:hypothetical protein
VTSFRCFQMVKYMFTAGTIGEESAREELTTCTVTFTFRHIQYIFELCRYIDIYNMT